MIKLLRSGWSGNMKGYKGDPMHIKVDQNKTKIDLNSLAICKEIAKIDADKLSQREVSVLSEKEGSQINYLDFKLIVPPLFSLTLKSSTTKLSNKLSSTSIMVNVNYHTKLSLDSYAPRR